MNNDLISSEALKKAILNQYDTTDPCTNYWWQNIEKIIDNAPTVEPTFGLFKDMLCSECDKRPKGEWIEHHIKGKDFFGNGFICECGRIVMQKENFCPNCGSDMRGEDI